MFSNLPNWSISLVKYGLITFLTIFSGRHLNGIHFAMSFLETWQKNQEGNDIEYAKLLAKDKDVVVIGGGDTGCDCIATSLRQV